MGWGNCGEDSEGRPIGYVFEATCDHPGCDKQIDRGLSYACGGMHGKYATDGNMEVCEKYFCGDHMTTVAVPNGTGRSTAIQVCKGCAHEIEEIKAQAYQELLAEMTQPALFPADFSEVGNPPEAPTAIDHRMKRIYDVLIEWDETDGMVLDNRYMRQEEFDRLASWRDDMARVRGQVVMGTSATV